MKRFHILAAIPAALAFYGASANTAGTVAGYRSNYVVGKNADGSATIVRSRDGAVTSLAADVGMVKFMDDYVSFDSAGVPGQAYRLYQAAFNRTPDASGLGFWIHAMQGGLDLETVAGYFYASSEFQATYGQVTDLQFLTLIYKNVLKRTPDQDGQDFWLKHMANGLSRPTVLRYFSESDENKRNVSAAIKDGITYTPFGGSDYSPSLQTYDARPTPHSANQRPAPPAGVALAAIPGVYQRVPVQNGFHSGRISIKAGTTDTLQWTNDSGLSWNLAADLPNSTLLTDSSNPYQKSGGKNFYLAYANGQVAGFYFMGELYARDGIVPATLSTPNLPDAVADSRGMGGYLAYRVPTAPSGYEYGFSQYIAMWPMVDQSMDNFQAGLGTWVIPDNASYNKALLPPDNAMRQNAPGGAPNWANLFQTIEGGSGNWISTQFPTREPKFAIVGTTDGYSHVMSGLGWAIGSQAAAPRSYQALAQLSNRIITPPDGFTFRSGTSGEFFGYAWMALPLTDARSATVPIGNRSWTLFFNAANFAGPVTFWIPDAWTRLSTSWADASGRGLDAMSARADSAAIEFGQLPSFHNGDKEGNLCVRIPRLLFPVAADGKSYLFVDRANYSANALFEPMRSWFNGGSAVTGTFDRKAVWETTLQEPSFGWNYASMAVSGLDKYVSPVISKTPGGGSAFGLEWTSAASHGVLPEYYCQEGKQLVARDAANVPAETMLGEVSFAAPSGRGASYTSPVSGAESWFSPTPAAGPFNAVLTDGSTVTYYWYKFIDQPSLQGYGWSAAQKASLQARVENLHRNWSGTREFMAPPTAGQMATLDVALLVTPPAGLEIGYVPVVTQQEKLR